MVQAAQYLPYLILALGQFKGIDIGSRRILSQRRQTNIAAQGQYSLNPIGAAGRNALKLLYRGGIGPLGQGANGSIAYPLSPTSMVQVDFKPSTRRAILAISV